ncbi:MAG TPA: hypothetical protein VEU96_18495 [Bryobacteraceae bacterium]|nr:hypothetical protein [Bryobacteraceae bacterium]
MKHHRTLPLASLMLALSLTCALAAPPAVVGDWEGAVQTGSSSLRVVLHVTQSKDGTLTGTFDSPDQGAVGIPLTTVTLDQPAFHFEIERFGCKYDGVIGKDNSEISGQWKQGTAALALNLKRVVK